MGTEEKDEWTDMECPCCGDVAAHGYWFHDGTALLCGCAGSIACDSETEPYVCIDECRCDEWRDAKKTRADLNEALALLRRLSTYWSPITPEFRKEIVAVLDRHDGKEPRKE